MGEIYFKREFIARPFTCMDSSTDHTDFYFLTALSNKIKTVVHITYPSPWRLTPFACKSLNLASWDRFPFYRRNVTGLLKQEMFTVPCRREGELESPMQLIPFLLILFRSTAIAQAAPTPPRSGGLTACNVSFLARHPVKAGVLAQNPWMYSYFHSLNVRWCFFKTCVSVG